MPFMKVVSEFNIDLWEFTFRSRAFFCLPDSY